MKICFCNNRFPPKIVGGAELIVHDLALQLKSLGHELSILTLSDSRESERYVIDELDVHAIPSANVYNQFSHEKRGRFIKVMFAALDTLNPLVFSHVLRHLKNTKPDVLCTHNLKGMGPAVWLSATVLGIPIVHVLHDYWLICPRSTMFKNERACAAPCAGCRRASQPKAWLSGMVAYVIGVSRFVLKQHLEQKFFPRAACSVIHNARPRLGGTASLPVSRHSPFRVGFIGRVDATKGIRECFEGIEAAHAADIELHVAGRDNDGVLTELMRGHPQVRVVHHGFVNSPEFYDVVDLVVVSSVWNEPFATVSFEPWEFHKPSIAFAVGGLTEVYEAFPELTVPRGDIAALGALIRRFVNDEDFYNEMARRCSERREYFLPARQAREFELILLRAQAGRDRRRTVVSDV